MFSFVNVKVNEEQPPIEKKKNKIIIDYAKTTFEEIRNFKVPNKKSYSILPEKSNKERLNDFIHSNLLMNHFTDSVTFYQRSQFYRCNALSHVGEYFCTDFGFDGIFVEVKEIMKPVNRLSAIRDNRLILLYYDDYTYLNSEIIESEKASCIYAMNVIKLLGKLKQFERDSIFINGIGTSPYTNYLCYLHIMHATLEKYYRFHEKIFPHSEKINLLTFDEFYLTINSLDNYFENNSQMLRINHRKNFISTILFYFDHYTLGTKYQPITLQTLLNNDKKIINEYKKLFGKNETAQQIIDAISSYTAEMLQEEFSAKQLAIKEFCHKHTLWYLKQCKKILKKKYINFINDVIHINGYSFITYIIDAVYMFMAESTLGFNHFLNLYNKHYKQNNLDITDSILQLK